MLRRRDFVMSSGLFALAPPSDSYEPMRNITPVQTRTTTTSTTPAGVLPTPIDYGAKGDGSSDDSNAFNQALANNAAVYVPPRRYLVGNVVINSGNSLIGAVGGPLYSHDPAGTRPALIAKQGATYVLDVHKATGFAIEGLLIDGLNNNPNGISDGSSFGTLRNLTVVNCNYGLGGSLSNGYSDVLRITDCEFGQCRTGLSNLDDSTITNCAVSTNYGDGIYMGDGSGATNFIALRSEWNAGYNVNLYNAIDVQFLGGMFDRGSNAGLFANGCRGLSLTGMLFRRNAANDITTTSSNRIADCHTFFQNCASVLMTGCRTRAGAGDNGTGAVSPKYAVRFGSGNTNFAITGCDLSGRTVASLSGTNPVGFSQLANVGT